MKKEEKLRLRQEARAKLEKFWNEQIQPLHQNADATFARLYQSCEEKEHVLMREVSSRLGLEVDEVYVAYYPQGMPEGKYLACRAVEDRDGQETWPNGIRHWKYRQVRYLPYYSKLAHWVQRSKTVLHREHMSALAQEYEPYFDQVVEAWRGIGADDYLAHRFRQMSSFGEAWMWEMALRDMELFNPLGALDILGTIAHSYMRGRNCRMGNMQTIWKHVPTKTAVMYQVARYASERNKEERWASFPCLRKCGVVSVDGFFEVVRPLLVERTTRRDERERQESKEAKRVGQQKIKDFMRGLKNEREGRYDILDEIKKLVDEGKRSEGGA